MKEKPHAIMRMRYLSKLYDEFLDFIQKEELAAQQKEIRKLLLENQALLGCDHATFTFNNQWYALTKIPEDPRLRKNWNRQIHEEILPKVIALLDEDNFETTRKNATISNFFSNVLPLINHVDDLNRLIPHFWLDKLPPIDPEMFNQADPMTDAEIEDIKQQTKAGFDYLKTLAMRHLLLQKTGIFA